MLPPLSAIADQLMSIEVYAPTVIFIVAFARLQFGSVVFAPRYAAIWNTIRKLVTPILQRAIYQTTFPNVQIENLSPEPVELSLIIRLLGKEVDQ